MTVPRATKKVNGGTPNQSAHAAHNRDSSMSGSPTSNTTARASAAHTAATWPITPKSRVDSVRAGARQHAHQHIGDVGADAVHTHLDQRRHAVGIVDRPHVDGHAAGME